MKKIILSICAIIFAAAFAACGAENSLDQLSKVFVRAEEAADNIDEVDEQDLNSGNVNNINMGVNFAPQIISTAEEEGGQRTVAEKITYIISLHSMIREKSLQIRDLRSEMRVSISEFKTLVKGLKDSGYTLTEEDKAFFSQYLSGAELNYTNLKDTIGKAYLKMYNLRGKYNFSNIDNIIAVYEDVNAVLDKRINSLTELNETLNNVNAYLEGLTAAPQES